MLATYAQDGRPDMTNSNTPVSQHPKIVDTQFDRSHQRRSSHSRVPSSSVIVVVVVGFVCLLPQDFLLGLGGVSGLLVEHGVVGGVGLPALFAPAVDVLLAVVAAVGSAARGLLISRTEAHLVVRRWKGGYSLRVVMWLFCRGTG